MAAIVSLGQMETVQRNWTPGLTHGSIRLYDSFNYDYATLYRLQPNVRTCVDFLARNIAQLGLHVFRRVSDTDRERLNDHPLAQLLAQPLPPEKKMTRYRLIETTMGDLGVYFNAYWLKFRGDGDRMFILPLPPMYVTVYGGLWPTRYDLDMGGRHWEFAPEQVVHFRGYNPENPLLGLAPAETLRRVLAEEHASGKYREGLWQNAARQSGIIKRPLAAPEWSETARERFLQDFAQLYAGDENSGKTAVLEEGMEWEPNTFSAQESEYLAGRKLTREECARAYHIPLPMVGILDHATFSNIREQHKHLYQDALGPWLAMIEQDIDLQLKTEFDDVDGVYVEFNIQEKLQGSFEEQTQSLQSAVGRPWMTANEARARQNLPSREGGDELVTPLNVIVGGQASPRDSGEQNEGVPNEQRGLPAGARKRYEFKADSHAPRLRQRHQDKWAEVLSSHYKRQEAAIVSRVPKQAAEAARASANGHDAKVDIGGVWFDEARWNRELSEDLFRLNNLTATAFAYHVAEQAGLQIDDRDAFEANMLPWLEEHSRIQAEYMNGQMRDELVVALRDPDPSNAVRNVFAIAVGAWALREAITAVTSAGNFGAHEAANAGGLRKKTWRTNSSNPRAAHRAMAGETVGIRERFSNGMRWPGDPAGGAENNANCQCSVVFST